MAAGCWRAPGAGGSASADDEPRGSRGRRGQALAGVLPIGDVPDGLDVVGLDIEVVEVEGVLPHVDLEERDGADRHVALLVEELEDDEPARDGVVGEHRPPGALDVQRRGGEVLLEGVEGAEGVPDGLRQLALGLAACARDKVLPKDRVVDVFARFLYVLL